MIAYRLVPVEPTEEMLAEGEAASFESISWTTAGWIYEAMIAAAPEVEKEPYAYEYGESNGDGTFSVVMNKGRLTQLGENEYGYCHPGIFASKEWPVTPLYLHPQPAPDVAKLVKALEEIIEWTDRWTSGDHPIATVAKRALEDYQQKGGKE